MKRTTYYLTAIMALAMLNTMLGGTANVIGIILISLSLIPAAKRMDKEARQREDSKRQRN